MQVQAGPIAILGAGAWGTAMAVHLARSGHAITLWARDPEQARHMGRTRENTRYLPDIPVPEGVRIVHALDEATHAAVLMLATPVAALPGLVEALRVRAAVTTPLAWLCKGLVEVAGTCELPHAFVTRTWQAPVAVISGPSFAVEVARGLPTALTVASPSLPFATALAQALRSETLRAYTTDDLVGVEVGGAVKNVLAIAAGASDGLGFGHNARAALVTRGLAETARLALAMGARRETLMGLAGLGDLVLTATGDASRNRRVGLGLARGEPLAQVLAALGHVAEGVTAAPRVRSVARAHAVQMPICEAVCAVLEGQVPIREAVGSLLAREPGRED